MRPPDPALAARPRPLAATVLGVAVLAATACAPAMRAPDPVPSGPAVGPAVEEPRGRDEPAEAPAETPAEPARRVVHVVREGETAWRIAHVYGIPLEELARANGLSDPTRLAAGDRLVVPGAGRTLDVPIYPAPLPTPGRVPLPATPGASDPGADLAWPLADRRILSGFGASRGGRRHLGIDIDADLGDAVASAGGGTVIYAGAGMRGYGKTVIVDHGDGLTTLYAHNSRLDVRVGDRVERGQVIARAGRTGNASGHHCHFEVRRNDVPVDPMPYLNVHVAARTP